MENKQSAFISGFNLSDSLQKQLEDALQKYSGHIVGSWDDTDVAREISYTMFKFADRGMFNCMPQGFIEQVLQSLIFVAQAGFREAQNRLKNQKL